MSAGQSLGFLDTTATHRAASMSAIARARITPAADTAYAVGDTLQLAVAMVDTLGASVSGAPVTWRTTDPNVASVDGAGAVVAHKAGLVTVMVTAGNATAFARVAVLPRVVDVRITGETPVRLREDERHRLDPEARDARGFTQSTTGATWRSADTSIATVDSLGEVTGHAPGRTTVAATIGGITGETSIEVTPVPRSVSLVSGDEQLALTGAPLAEPIVAQVLSRSGRPVQGARVRFGSMDGGGVDVSTGVTDTAGYVRTHWTLGASPGRQRLVVTVDGIDGMLAVAATAHAPVETKVPAAASKAPTPKAPATRTASKASVTTRRKP